MLSQNFNTLGGGVGHRTSGDYSKDSIYFTLELLI